MVSSRYNAPSPIRHLSDKDIVRSARVSQTSPKVIRHELIHPGLLESVQPYVNPEILEHKRKSSSHPPVDVLYHKGHYILTDGNHRAAADLLERRMTRAKVLYDRTFGSK